MPLKSPNFTGIGGRNITVGTIESQDATSVQVNLGNDAGDDFIVDTNTLVVEGDNGRVGIGTTAPGATLGIDGDLHFQPTVTSTGHITTAGSLDIRATDNIRIGTDGADSIRIGRENSSACKVHIRSGSNADLVVTDGKVGIGMEDPSDALEVDGDIQLTPTATSTAHLKTTGSLDVRASGNIRIGTDGADSVRLGRVNSTAVKVHVRSGTDSDLVVTNSKVGIGTDDPGTTLQLSSTTTAITLQNTTEENSDGGCESKIIFEDHANVTLAQIQGSHDGSSDDTKGDLIFSTHTGSTLTEAMRIDSSQQVVIPDGKLVLNATAVTATATELNLLDGVSGLVQADLTKLAAVDATAAEIDLLDGDTTVGGSITIADNDGFVINDGGTMKTIPASDIKTYAGGSVAADDSNLVLHMQVFA